MTDTGAMNTERGGLVAMIRYLLAAVTILGLAATSLSAQETTERYIPIGRSPGLSYRYTYVGEIIAMDVTARTVTVRGREGTRAIAVTDRTRIWLDRTALSQSNTVGQLSDLRVGRRVEIKYEDSDSKETADWIKVAVQG